MNLPLIAGREFDESTRAGAAVIVNDAFARKFFTGRSALGAILRLGDAGEARTVIGVARDTLQRDFTRRNVPVLYVPFADEDYRRAITLVVRTAASAGMVVPAVREAIYAADPAIPAQVLQTMEQRMEMPRWPSWTASGLFGTCGIFALLLATVGLFAMIAQTVASRTREFGLRMALGATDRSLAGRVLADGLWLIVPGIVAGLLLAAVLVRSIGVTFPGIILGGPVTYAAAGALQLTVALVACLSPARRAARIDPLTALRAE
jgi:putative ABC transport system permease protein